MGVTTSGSVLVGGMALRVGDIYHGRLMIFSDRSIRDAIESGSIVIDPYEPRFVQPSSVDLRVGNGFRVFVNHRYSEIDPRSPQDDLTQLVEMAEDEPFMLHPGEFVLGSTLERVKLGNDVVARLEGKSSLGRLGLLIHSTAGFIDPGFEGHITLELSNVATLPIAIYPTMKIGQISFYRMTTAAEFPYGSPELGSKYQGQSGPTASRSHRDFDSSER
jgi:dCTP deaminase